MRNATNRHIVRMEGGALLHTRKGWRGDGMAKPRGTNKRRVPTKRAFEFAPLSRASRVEKGATRSHWNNFKVAIEGWLDSLRQMRWSEAERVRQEAEEAEEKALVEKANGATA